jgi:4-hydroxy-2-oxoglutarate aldolase
VGSPVLEGVFAPVVTPFHADELDLEALRSNLRRLGQAGLAGYLALGSNGEARSLTGAEQDAVLAVFAEEAVGKTVMVGTGCESTRETIERTRAAAAMGFPYASVLTPSYFASRMTDDVLETHYLRVADASKVQILVYNAPGFAGGVQVSPSLVARLAGHPNIAGMKDSSKPGPGRYLAVLPDDVAFKVLAGSTTFFYPALCLGAVGGVLSLANSLPEACCRLYDLYREGRHEEARGLHASLTRLNAASSGKHGVAGVKALMDLMGYQGGEPRLPFRALGSEARKRLNETLTQEGLADG